MKNIHFPKFLDYIPPIIAFVAAVVAIVGAPKWNEKALGIFKITPLGWAVLGIGLLALIASLLVTARNSREQRQQRHARERIAAIGKKGLLEAILHSVHPLTSSSLWNGKMEAPRSPADFMDPARREVLAGVELTGNSPYSDGSAKDYPWHEIIQGAAKEGRKRVFRSLQIYSSYLPAEVMDVVTRYTNSEFLWMRLAGLTTVVNANVRFAPSRPVRFFMVKDDHMHNPGYEEFWTLLDQAIQLCGGRTVDGRAMFDR